MTSKNRPPSPGNGPFVVTKVLALSATVSAAMQFVITNPGLHTGLNVFWQAHSFPGSASTTFNLAMYAVDPATSGTFAVYAPGSAQATASTLKRFMVGQGLASATDLAVNANVGNQYIIQISMSTGATSKDVVFSLGLEWTP